MSFKLLLSINYKFFLDNPKELIDLVKENDKNRVIDGFEFYFDNTKESDKNYILEAARLCRENNYILNLHSRNYINRESYNEYLEFVDELSKIYGRRINLTCHPLEAQDKTESFEYTKNVFTDILATKMEHNYNFDIAIENLNIYHGVDRLTIKELEKIIKENKDLKLTFDIGHEIIDNHSFTRLNGLMLERLNNIHLHNHYSNKDHYPIEVGDLNIDLFKDIIKYLKSINYDKTVVLEYAADYVKGDDQYEKLYNFVEHAKFFNEISY